MPACFLTGILLLAGASVSILPQDEESASTQQEDALDPEALGQRLQEARAKLEGLPGGTDETSPEAQLRGAWARRVELLEEALALLDRSAAQKEAPDKIEQLRESLELRKGEPIPEPTAPASPTKAGMEELEGELATQRKQVAELRDLMAEKSQDLEALPNELKDTRARLEAATERETRLKEEAAAAGDSSSEALELQAENAALDARVARLEAKVLERDGELEKLRAPLRADELDLAQRKLEALDDRFRLYTAALDEEMEREQDRLAARIETLEEVVESAQGPLDRFEAEKRLAIAEFEKATGERQRDLLALRTELDEQETRLAAESEELRSLRDYLSKAGTGPAAAGPDQVHAAARQAPPPGAEADPGA